MLCRVSVWLCDLYDLVIDIIQYLSLPMVVHHLVLSTVLSMVLLHSLTNTTQC